MKKSNWLIGIGGSDLDRVISYRVNGSKDAVKKHLMSLVTEDRNDNSRDYEHGTEQIGEIFENSSEGTLYAYNCFDSYHIDYMATPERKVMVLD